MVMLLPIALVLLAPLLATAGMRRAALGFGVLTVVVQVAWLHCHATDRLAVSL